MKKANFLQTHRAKSSFLLLSHQRPSNSFTMKIRTKHLLLISFHVQDHHGLGHENCTLDILAKNPIFFLKNVFTKMGHFCVQEHKKRTVLDKRSKVQKCILAFILVNDVMTTSKRCVKFLSLIFILKCLSKFNLIRFVFFASFVLININEY